MARSLVPHRMMIPLLVILKSSCTCITTNKMEQGDMLAIKGAFNSTLVYADGLEKGAIGQLTALCNQPFTKSAKLRIMHDAHAGSGCVIGTTMTIDDKIVPNLVGVDIGCGMERVNIGKAKMDFRKLDKVIRESVPNGFGIRDKSHRFVDEWDIEQLNCAKILQKDKALNSIGTLGGGNHFIEVARDCESDDYFLIIHSGSRNPIM